MLGAATRPWLQSRLRGRTKDSIEQRKDCPMQINDLFGAAAAFETVRMPDGTEAAIPTEHAAVIYVNEQPAFRVPSFCRSWRWGGC